MESILLSGRNDTNFVDGRNKRICTPELYFIPNTVHELRQIIVAASVNKKHVQIKGNNDLVNNLSSTKDYLVSLLNINKIIQTDVHNETVTVETGIDLYALEFHLNKCGLSLPISPLPSNVNLNEALTQGHHGSGWNYGILATYVMDIELMTSSGETRKLSHSDGELFHCACVSLGALGIITRVTLQCRPHVKRDIVSYGLAIRDFLENIETHGKASDHLYVDWYPYTDHVMVHHSVHTQRTNVAHNKISWSWLILLSVYVMHVLFTISARFPSTTRWMSKMAYYIKRKTQKIPHSHGDDKYFATTEWAFPRVKTALVLYELQQHILRRDLPVRFPVRLMFCKGDQIPLSSAYNMDICYITVPHTRFDEGANQVLTIYNEIISSAGGYQSLAMVSGSQPEKGLLLLPQLDNFNKHRFSVDSSVMFCNTFLDKLLKI